MSHRLKIFIMAAFILASTRIFPEEYRIERIKSYDHLNGEFILSGMQDQYGFLWFSTSHGLYKFNGKNFDKLLIPKYDKESKSVDLKEKVSSKVTCIFQDSKGIYWISVLHYIVRYDGFEFKYMDLGFNNTGAVFQHIIETKDGAIWFSSPYRLLRYHNSKFQDLTNIAVISSNSKLKLSEREVIREMFLDADNSLNIVTRKGIKKYNGKNFSWVLYDASKFETSYSFLKPSSDTLLIGEKNGDLKIFSNGKISTEHFGGSTPIYSVFKDSRGNLWIGTKSGLFEFDGINKKFIRTTLDPKPSPVLQVFEDREHNIWACTIREICKIQRTEFKKITIETMADLPGVFSLDEDSKGRIWIGTGKQGLFTIENGEIIKPEINLGKDIKSIRSIEITKSDNIWIHTNKGLLKITDNDVKTFFEIDGINTKVISSMKLDKTDKLYFLDEMKKLRVFDGKKLESPVVPTKDKIIGLIKNEKGEIILRTVDYLYSLDGHYKFPIGDRSTSRKMYLAHMFDHLGQVWCSPLDEGLLVAKKYYNKIKYQNITKRDGLLDDHIRTIFQDKDGFLWVGSFLGVSRFDMKTFLNTGQKLFENFINADNEETKTVRIFFQDSKGNVWAGTTHGLMKFDYKNLKKKVELLPPPVYITDFKLFMEKINYLDYSEEINERTGLPEDLVLPYDKNYITFSYVGLYYTDPDAIEYQYRLLGFDAGWSPIVKMDERTYTNLPPGEYTFEVKARNKDGQWSVRPASFSFTISPPFWKTWWFYMLSIGFAISAVFTYINLKTRNLKKQKMILERTVEERTSELQLEKIKVEAANQDLEKSRYQLAKINELQEKWLKELSESEQELLESNESKDKLFSLISHDLRSPFRSLMVYSQSKMGQLDEMSTEEVRSYLENVYKSTENIYKLVEDLLEWSRVQTGRMECNPDLFDISDTITGIIDILGGNAEKKNISIENNAESDCLVYADESMIKSVLNNLISNAIKFTNSGGQIEITTDINDGTVEISVKDNGVGLSPEDMGKLFKVGTHFHNEGTAKEKGTGLGLILCKELIEKNEGTISVVSKLGEGSAFIITLPRFEQE